MLRPLPPPLLRDEPWANGAGTTTVLAAWPDALDWRWRISIARIAAPCRFSAYPGAQRQLAPLDGPLLLRFAGTPPPRAELPGGPTRAFNLMTRDCPATLLARPLVGTMLLPAAPCWLLHQLAGSAKLQQDAHSLELRAGESAELSGTCRIGGHGELVLARIEA
jgi:environmental stress-induced protein Ves